MSCLCEETTLQLCFSGAGRDGVTKFGIGHGQETHSRENLNLRSTMALLQSEICRADRSANISCKGKSLTALDLLMTLKTN